MGNSKVSKGDEIVVLDQDTLPNDWEQYIGDEFTVRSTSGAGEIFITLPNGNEMVLMEQEYNVVNQNIYTRQKRELNV